MKPLQLAFYKGIKGKLGAIQFNPQKPHYYCEACGTKFFGVDLPPRECSKCKTGQIKTREGCLFMEVANTTAPNEYDWTNKGTLALSPTDMTKLLMVTEGRIPEVSIFHDPGAKSDKAGQVNKKLVVSSPNGIKDEVQEDGKTKYGGCMIKLSVTAGGETKQYTVPLDQYETTRLAVCLRQMITSAVSW